MRIGLAGALMLFSAAQAAADIPAAIIDFDRQVGFSTPLLTPVFRAFNDEHLYFVFPNALTLDRLQTGAPDLTLLYDKSGSGGDAFITVAGTVGFAGDHQTAIDEVRATDAQARFVNVEPAEFSFTLHTPGADQSAAVIDSAKLDSKGRFEILARVDDITTRILLLPESYKFDSVAVVYAPVYRGVVRDDDGTPKLKLKPYTIGAVDGGGCALSPERYQSWTTKQIGCKHPAYPYKLVKRIQAALRAAGQYEGGLDGVYGPLTQKAIRLYQKEHQLVVDGIPTEALADMLKG